MLSRKLESKCNKTNFESNYCNESKSRAEELKYLQIKAFNALCIPQERVLPYYI